MNEVVYNSSVVGTGHLLPECAVSNDMLPSPLDLSDEWIVQRTGIRTRHIARNSTPLDMAEAAARIAIESARIEVTQVDLILAATISADYVFPSLSTLLQHRLGCRNVGAFDISAACSGFVYGLSVAEAQIASGRAEHVLLVSSEKMSRWIRPADRSTFVLFGDGAGAVVLSRSERRGVHSIDLYSDGGTTDILNLSPALGQPYIHMNGKAVFRMAVRTMVSAIRTLLERNRLAPAEINWFIPHQANARIISAVRAEVGIPEDRVIVTLRDHGNVSAASIPIALDIAVRDGRVRKGDKLLIAAAGGGFTWGTAMIEW